MSLYIAASGGRGRGQELVCAEAHHQSFSMIDEVPTLLLQFFCSVRMMLYPQHHSSKMSSVCRLIARPPIGCCGVDTSAELKLDPSSLELLLGECRQNPEPKAQGVFSEPGPTSASSTSCHSSGIFLIIEACITYPSQYRRAIVYLPYIAACLPVL
jgi:hypothetical protein